MNRLNEIATVHRYQSGPPDLLVIARALWAGKWRVAGMVLLALSLAAAHIVTTEPRYRAKAILSLEPPERNVVQFDEPGNSPPAEEKKLETEAEVLRSRGLLENLVRDLSLSADPEFNPTLMPVDVLSPGWAVLRVREIAGLAPPAEPDAQAALTMTIDRVAESIEVIGVPNTYLLEVHVETGSPSKSADIANALARLYIVSRIETRFESNSRAIEWLTREVDELKNALRSAEENLKSFTASAEVRSPEVLLHNNVQLKSLRERHVRSLEIVRRAEQRSAIVRDLMRGIPPDSTSLAQTDPEFASILSRTPSATGSEPGMNALRRLLAQSEAEVERETRSADATAKAISDLEARIGRQSSEIVELQQLEREIQANAAIYEFALTRLKQLSVERGIQFSGARILSRAEPPLRPSGPGAATVGALAVALGCMLGVGIILVQQRVQDSFRTVEEIERLSNIKVLGQVPNLPTRRRRTILKAIVADRPSLFSEAVRNLRASLLAIAGTPRIVIVLNSAMPGEGKTTLAMALARSLAAIGKKVLLIDADMRLRTLSRQFVGFRRSGGLAAAMLDGQPISELVVRSDAIGADILLSHAFSGNAADIFSSDTFRRVISSARKMYHVTIIDTPPSLVVSDARMIAKHADMLLLAVKWNKTTKWQFADAVRELETANCVVTGCVLTQVDPKGMKKYGYGDRRGALAGYRAGYYK